MSQNINEFSCNDLTNNSQIIIYYQHNHNSSITIIGNIDNGISSNSNNVLTNFGDIILDQSDNALITISKINNKTFICTSKFS